MFKCQFNPVILHRISLFWEFAGIRRKVLEICTKLTLYKFTIKWKWSERCVWDNYLGYKLNFHKFSQDTLLLIVDQLIQILAVESYIQILLHIISVYVDLKYFGHGF